MKKVFVVCEGHTEKAFTQAVLVPAFRLMNLELIGQMIQTCDSHKGGSLSYDRVKKHLRDTLRQKDAHAVTTLFDLYRLDTKFPGFKASQKERNLEQRLAVLTQALHVNVVQEADCKPERFIPYIQPYEFEALLFSDVPTLTRLEQGWEEATTALLDVRKAAKSPEHINDRPDNKPSAHLKRALKQPSYSKTLHGPIAAREMGLAKLEAECSFFAGWLKQIRALGNL